MATPPYNIDITKPENTMKIAQYPANERSFRDIVKSWFEQIADPTTGNLKSSAFGDTFTITSTDASASGGPFIVFDRNSASPNDADGLGMIRFLGRNDAAEEIEYARITSAIIDASDGTEDGSISFALVFGAALSNRLVLSSTGNTIAGNTTVNGTLSITG